MSAFLAERPAARSSLSSCSTAEGIWADGTEAHRSVTAHRFAAAIQNDKRAAFVIGKLPFCFFVFIMYSRNSWQSADMPPFDSRSRPKRFCGVQADDFSPVWASLSEPIPAKTCRAGSVSSRRSAGAVISRRNGGRPPLSRYAALSYAHGKSTHPQ